MIDGPLSKEYRPMPNRLPSPSVNWTRPNPSCVMAWCRYTTADSRRKLALLKMQKLGMDSICYSRDAIFVAQLLIRLLLFYRQIVPSFVVLRPTQRVLVKDLVCSQFHRQWSGQRVFVRHRQQKNVQIVACLILLVRFLKIGALQGFPATKSRLLCITLTVSAFERR